MPGNQCPHCNKTSYSTEANVRRHIKRYHPEHYVVPPQRRGSRLPDTPELEVWECGFCKAWYATNTALRQHVLKHHDSTLLTDPYSETHVSDAGIKACMLICQQGILQVRRLPGDQGYTVLSASNHFLGSRPQASTNDRELQLAQQGRISMGQAPLLPAPPQEQPGEQPGALSEGPPQQAAQSSSTESQVQRSRARLSTEEAYERVDQFMALFDDDDEELYAKPKD